MAYPGTVSAVAGGTGSSGTDATSYQTGSVSLTADRLYYLIAAGRSKDASTHDLTITASGGGTWDVEGGPQYVSASTSVWGAALFRCVPASNYTGVITIDYGSELQEGAHWAIVQVTEADTGNNGADASVQVVENRESAPSGGDPSVTLSAFTSLDNATIGIHVGSNVGVFGMAPGGSFTEVIETRTSDTVSLIYVQWLNTEDTTVTTVFSNNSGGYVSWGLEVRPPASVATHLGFNEQPTNAAYDVAIAPAITVFALNDAEGVDTSYTGDVTLTISTNPGTGAFTVGSTTTVAAVAGVATFSDVAIDEIGTGYKLTATADGLTDSPESAAFNILDQVATHLAFDAQPTNVQEDTVFGSSITVNALKPDETVDTDFTGNITIAIGTNPTGGVLSGTQEVAAVAGVATFTDLEISKPGTGYTLIATGAGLTQGTSDTFNVTLEPATHLIFFVGPSNTQVDAIITPAIKVRARNSENVLDTNYTGDVTLAIQTNPGTGVLGGTLTKAAVAGVATFDDLTIDEVGAGYQLRATASGLTLADSATFNITTGPVAAEDIGGDIIMGGATLEMRL